MLSLLSLLFVSCGEDDTPTATLPPDAAPADSTETVTPTTELVTFQAVTAYYADEFEELYQDMDHHYLMVSNRQGEVLSLEPYQIGQRHTVSVDTAIADERVQVSLLHTGTTADENGNDVALLMGFGYMDVARGAELLMNFTAESPRPALLGYAQVLLEQVDKSRYYHGDIRTYRGYASIDNEQMDTLIQVPIYREGTPMSLILTVDGELYIHKVDALTVDSTYTIDVSALETLKKRSVMSPVDSYDYIYADVDGFFIEPGDLSYENRLSVGYGFGTDEGGNPIMLDPGNLYPAYETSFYVDQDNFSQHVEVKGAIPDQFQLPNVSATFGRMDSHRFDMTIAGDYDVHIAEWIKINEDGNRAVLWTSIGSPATASGRLPQLPDTLAFSTDSLSCERMVIREYDHINSHDAFLEEAATQLYNVERGSTRHEELEYEFHRQNNGRRQNHYFLDLFLNRDW